MKWFQEDNFENIAIFLGKLFDRPSEEIKERFVSIPEMYVLKFGENENDIVGTLIGVKDELAPNILEVIYIAFEADFDFAKYNVFGKFKNFCKIDFIEVVFSNNVSVNSFVNLDLEVVEDDFILYNRANMKLTLENYKKKWYDLEGRTLIGEKNDFPELGKKIKLKKGKKTEKFMFLDIKQISTENIAYLQKKSHSKSKFEDNMSVLSGLSKDYNMSIISKVMTGHYGELSDKASFVVTNGDGKLVGYVLGLAPRDKIGHIFDYVVDPDYLGYGLGMILFRNVVLNYFEKLECENVTLNVTLTNTQAVKIYEENGFEAVFKIAEGILMID